MAVWQRTFWREWGGRGPSWLTWIGRHELGTLTALAVIAFLCWGFVELADEVFEGGAVAFDERIILAMRTAGDPADPVGPRWFEEMVRDITGLGGSVVLVGLTLTAAAYLAMEGKRHAMILVMVAAFGGMAVGGLLKLTYERARPSLVPHLTYVSTDSFPSGHAVGAAVTYLTLAALLMRISARRRVKAFLLLVGVTLTVLVGVSRVYLGVHWPSDVLAGWAIGASWALLCWAVARHLQRRGQVESETQPPAPS